MKIICPSCLTSYIMIKSAKKVYERLLRCSTCGNTWQYKKIIDQTLDSTDSSRRKHNYKIFGTNINFLLDKKILEHPNYVKIDVDGIEHLVLSGGIEILKNVKEILIELPGVWDEQTNTSNKLLIESGFTLTKDHKFDPITNPTVAANQIWKRL